MNSPAKILLLEDDANLGLIVSEHLRLNGYDVDLVKNGSEGLELYDHNEYDLCLVDIMMPKMDGFTFARNIRAAGDEVPIVFLTAKSLQEDKIEGFRIGCDDYITKPFSVEELLLRIQAVLKRAGRGAKDDDRTFFKIAGFEFDSLNRTLSCDEQMFKLTSKEAELLRLLCLNLNQTLDRSVALKNIWGEESYFSGRSMDVFISKLRKYLKHDNRIEIINIHGRGFKLIVNL